MKLQKFIILLFLLLTISCQELKKNPIGVDVNSKVMRSGDNGDNWFMTIGEDGALYTAQCDGRGWYNKDGSLRDFKNHQVWQITGGPDSTSFHSKMIHYH